MDDVVAADDVVSIEGNEVGVREALIGVDLGSPDTSDGTKYVNTAQRRPAIVAIPTIPLKTGDAYHFFLFTNASPLEY